MYIERILTWFNHILPEVAESLNPPALQSEIDELEGLIEVKLPVGVRDLYLFANGQNSHASTGLWYGFPMLSLEEIANDWQCWNELFSEDYMQEFIWSDEHSSYKDGFVKPMYANPKWIPLANDSGGNNFGLDFDPGPNGQIGQVINFGRDEFVKYVLANSFEEFLKWYADQLESGNYRISSESYDGEVVKVLNTRFPSTEHFLDAVPKLFR